MFAWQFEPSVVAGIGLLTAAYVVGVALPGRAPAARIAAFLTAMLVLSVALVSPIDTIGDRYLFSVHMIQHLLLVLIVPPLMIYGTPGWVVRPLASAPLLGGAVRFLGRGPIAFAVYNGVFALAHLPPIFDLTLRSEGVHIVEHLLFIATGIMAWWPILSPLDEAPRLSYPFQMLYLFLMTLPCSLVGALITLSGDVLYTPYSAAERSLSVAPLSDQQVGGLAMWIGGSVFYFLAFMVVFFLWAQHDEPERRRFIIIKGMS